MNGPGRFPNVHNGANVSVSKVGGVIQLTRVGRTGRLEKPAVNLNLVADVNTVHMSRHDQLSPAGHRKPIVRAHELGNFKHGAGGIGAWKGSERIIDRVPFDLRLFCNDATEARGARIGRGEVANVVRRVRVSLPMMISGSERC